MARSNAFRVINASEGAVGELVPVTAHTALG